MEASLVLKGEYSREDVCRIFDPFYKFVPKAGRWGISGIVRIPERKKHYVLFVTYGQEQAGHVFVESITEIGIFSWQSQPQQKLSSKVIQDLINQDPLTDMVYLFLRKRERNPVTHKIESYLYLGRLAYLNHDVSLERPVYCKWQLLDWEQYYNIDLIDIRI